MSLFKLPKSRVKWISKFLLIVMIFEILVPLRSFALTTGPSQPEMQSFEPVGTTNLVDPFSGDFTYNIPLLDVEGYPINIAYHSGIDAEQEASWVGLGWNINPGNVNHMVRGVPDDFNGDIIKKKIEINDEVSKSFSVGVSPELFGIDVLKNLQKVGVSLNLTLGMKFNNYTGLSASFAPSAGFTAGGSSEKSSLMGGVNIGLGVSTDQGADFDYSFSLSRKGAVKNATSSHTASFGQHFNSSQGLQNTTFGLNASVGHSKDLKNPKKGGPEKGSYSKGQGGIGSSNTPIALSNYVPVITNAFMSKSNFYQLRVGFEAFGGYVEGSVSVGSDRTSINTVGDRKAYGFFNLQNAGQEDILDFSRDRDGRFNPKMKNLPPSNMTYDIFSVTGQGTAGSYRAFRDDIGSVYDPFISSRGRARSILGDVGFANLFEVGLDLTNSVTWSTSGPWAEYSKTKSYSKREPGDLHEPYYMKQAGELTLSNENYQNQLNANDNPLTASQIKNVNYSGSSSRVARSNLMYFFNAYEAEHAGVSLNPKLENYETAGFPSNPTLMNRTDNGRRNHHVSEVVQVLPDGRRYIYGLPAMNIEQREYVLSVDATDEFSSSPANKIIGDINLSQADPSHGEVTDANLGQNFFMKTTTPAHAHSYQLTNILSSDYVDLTGDGISDDDLGSYTKFNYTLKTDKYVWRAPYDNSQARLDFGVRSDCHDDKGAFTIGRKEVWQLHSVETKNYVAEFYTSPRVDAAGAQNIGDLGGVNKAPSFKLDKIVLYNKQDRKDNGASAKPIKEVHFTYDYSLCPGVPNQQTATYDPSVGKLTLKAISIKNGASDIGLLSPYRFEYNQTASYGQFDKDCWGGYKPDNSNNNHSAGGATFLDMSNHEYPYVNQNESKATADQYASTWNLSKIHLPSGGTISVEYESDDYAYVQDKRAMEMYKVEGVGSSPAFNPGNSLYQDQKNPMLYIYFRKKGSGNELNLGSGVNPYTENDQDVQFNFEVIINKGEQTPSCNIPLVDNIKGYADIKSVGDCGDGTHGYIEIKPKNASRTGALISSLTPGGVDGMLLNPISVAAINYSRYYNNKSLNPASELVDPNPGALLKAFSKALGQYADYVRNPMVKYMNKGLAQKFNKGRSFIRLRSQGFKRGGGHRVKQVMFSDEWDEFVGGTPVATYGSKYSYETVDEQGNTISSGVASYEPLLGGDENPCKQQLSIDRIGNPSSFPRVDPIELMNEAPIGEAFFPSASVGYSKVKISSIHKAVGKSSQLVQEHEFYTAKDFPVKTKETQIDIVNDRNYKKISFKRNKKEWFKATQGYAIILNDMHGKPKKQTTWINGNDDPVAYKKYNYYTDDKNKSELDNKVDVLDVLQIGTSSNAEFLVSEKELGVETDFTIDTREKVDHTTTLGFMFNLNTFLLGIIPLPVPTPLPKIPKTNEKKFNSVVGTKIVQKYGILKSVESYDKGAKVILSNDVFDPVTGEVLLTSVNTEYEGNDKEYNFKIPAYWAHQEMGPAYENILYEEDVPMDKARIANDIVYYETSNLDRFNIGDEVIFDISNACALTSNEDIAKPESYKMWVVDKGAIKIPKKDDIILANPDLAACSSSPCSMPSTQSNSSYQYGSLPLVYDMKLTCHNPAPATPIDYSDINNNYTSTLIANNIFPYHDVCNIPYRDLFSGQAIRKVLVSGSSGNPILANADNTVNRFYDEFINHSQFADLKSLLIGSNLNESPYPLEKATFEVSHGDEVHNYPQSELIADGLTTPLASWAFSNSMYRLIPQEHGYRDHTQHNATMITDPNGMRHPSSQTLTARKINNSAYNNAYSNFQNIDIGTSSHLLKVEIKLSPLINMTLTNGGNQQQVTMFDPNATQHVDHSTRGFIWTHRFEFPCKGSNNYALIQNVVNNLNNTTYSLYNNNQIPYNGTSSFAPFIFNKTGSPPNEIFNSDLSSGTTVSFDSKLMYKVTSEIVPRPKTTKSVIVLKAQKRDMKSFNGITTTPLSRWNGTPLPANDIINKAKIKVIRSGKRNMLSEAAQNIASLSNPINTNGPSLSEPKFDDVLSISATRYSNLGYAPEQVADLSTDWHNEFILGLISSYRPLENYLYHNARDYNSSFDRSKGTFSTVPSFWKLGFANGSPQLFESVGGTNTQYNINVDKWHAKSRVLKYDTWGNDAEVRDASGAIHSNLFAYNHKLPTAIISNSQSDNTMFENFEDIGSASYWYLPFYGGYAQNQFKDAVYGDMYLGQMKMGIDDESHTGAASLAAYFDITIPVEVSAEKYSLSNPNSNRALSQFYFRPSQKYYLSYWQKVGQNAAIWPVGKMTLSLGGTTFSFKPQTPNIDGWVQYAGYFTVPAGAATSTINQFFLTNGNSFDDLRIVPAKANMKSYVYNAVNQRLVAVLDENNMATQFDYSAEGKLQRIKKETERGLLTLKESRESLKNIINPPLGTSWPRLNDATTGELAPTGLPSGYQPSASTLNQPYAHDVNNQQNQN